jgi:hypothetical protein
MIHEYFIEPDLIYKWASDYKETRFFLDSIGVGSPRLMSSFPESKPSRLTHQLLKNIPKEMPEVARLRVDEFATALKSEAIKRKINIDLPENWIDAAEAQCEMLPPDVVVAAVSNKQIKCWVSEREAYRRDAIFDHPHQLSPVRTAAGLTDAVCNLLRYSKKIIIVDPYLYKKSGIETVVAFINASVGRRIQDGAITFQLIFDDSKSNPGFIVGQVAEAARKNSVGIEVLAVKEKNRGEKLHNRYVLTELGGVSFGVGTDAGEEYHSDDVFLLDRKLYEKRMAQYFDAAAFDVVNSEVMK